MANAENAKIQIEGGQQQQPMSALSNSGDNTVFESGSELWSRRSGYEPVVRPDGLITGGAITPAQGGTPNAVDVAALTAYVGGAQVAAAAETGLTCARPITDTHLVYSIVVDEAGAITAESGTEGTSFSETRGSAGGPPLIPVGSIEVGQVRLNSQSSAAVKASEVFQVVGVHQERYDFPIFEIDYRNGSVVFNSALPTIHTGDEPKGVSASYAEPIFTDLARATDFVPSETSHSLSSTQIYGGTIGSSSSTLNQARFTAFLNDGITDGLIKLKNEILWFKFFQNRFQSNYILEQGKLGISRTFPAGDDIQAACTISPEEAGVEVTA